MPSSAWRVAVLDSGCVNPTAAPFSGLPPLAACRFVDTGREVLRTPAIDDASGHGTTVADIISSAQRPVRLLIGQVLDHQGVTTAAAVAAGILWSIEEGSNLIHMSLGLREDRRVLGLAVEAAIRAGCIVVASTPARGEGTFPARYPQVISATGDARCERDEISALNSPQADFGGCPGRMFVGAASGAESVRQGGASFGAAHLTRFLIERIAPGSEVGIVRAQLQALARYQGIERKS